MGKIQCTNRKPPLKPQHFTYLKDSTMARAKLQAGDELEEAVLEPGKVLLRKKG